MAILGEYDTKYFVRKYCITCGEMVFAEQLNIVDPDWIPTGHEGHTFKDFVIVWEEQVPVEA